MARLVSERLPSLTLANTLSIMRQKSRIFLSTNTSLKKILTATTTTPLCSLCGSEAVANANLDTEAVDSDRFGVILSTGIGGILEIEEQVARMNEKGPKRIRPMALPKALPNMAAGNIAMQVGANGVCKCVITACASSNDALGEAFREIKFGFQDVMLAGGSEAAITPFAIGGFQALTAMSTTEDQVVLPFLLTRTAMVL